MIIIYIIVMFIMQFILIKMHYKALRSKIENYNRYTKRYLASNAVWLDFEEGWIISFGGIFFPLVFIILFLFLLIKKLKILCEWLSQIWDNNNLTNKIQNLLKKGGFID